MFNEQEDAETYLHSQLKAKDKRSPRDVERGFGKAKILQSRMGKHELFISLIATSGKAGFFLIVHRHNGESSRELFINDFSEPRQCARAQTRIH